MHNFGRHHLLRFRHSNYTIKYYELFRYFVFQLSYPSLFVVHYSSHQHAPAAIASDAEIGTEFETKDKTIIR